MAIATKKDAYEAGLNAGNEARDRHEARARWFNYARDIRGGAEMGCGDAWNRGYQDATRRD